MPTAEFCFEFNPNNSEQKVDFPDEFKKFKQTLLITELDNLYYNPNPDDFWHNTTILDLRFDTAWVFNYPQDWFNKSNADFGYQWITRAISNPETNLIEGQEIRITDFILDETYNLYMAGRVFPGLTSQTSVDTFYKSDRISYINPARFRASKRQRN